MARKRQIDSDDDYTDDDASFEPKKRRTSAGKGRKPAKRLTKSKGAGREHDASDAEVEYMADAQTPGSPETLQTRPHSVSLHVISRPEPLRQALSEWYEGVHESRGMPWRKPFDHSWDAGQRAQRAYEVRSPLTTSRLQVDPQ